MYTIEELEKLLEGTTPASWAWVHDEGWNDNDLKGANGATIIDDGSADGEYTPTITPDKPDAKLIAAAPDLARRLIELLKQRDAALAIRKGELSHNGKHQNVFEEIRNRAIDEFRKALGAD